MFAYVFLAVLVAAVSAGPTDKVTCNNITPLQGASVTALAGNWVAVESVSFNAGFPVNPANVNEDPRSHTCINAKSRDVSESGVTIANGATTPKGPIVETVTLTVVGEEKSRLAMQSDKNNRENWELLVIDANTDKHLVYVTCQPPNEAGERLPDRVNLMARSTGADTHSLSAEEIAAVERNMAAKLDITGRGVQPVPYAKGCWA